MKKKDEKKLESVVLFFVFILLIFWLADRSKFWIILVVLLLILFVGILVVTKLKAKKFNQFSSNKDLLAQLKQMSPTQFEVYIADLYNKLGYETKQIGGSYDGGIDVIATKKGVTNYIQFKKFITRQVGVGDIRDFYGAMADKLTNAKGIFITTNVFTTEAEHFASDKPLELIDGRKLLRLISLTLGNNNDNLITTEPNNKCPKCGQPLVERQGKHGKFIGCSGYPVCNFTKSTGHRLVS